MRRDLCFGLLVSLLVNSLLVCFSGPSAAAVRPPHLTPVIQAFLLPQLTPDDPPPVAEERKADRPDEPAAPSLPDVPGPAAPDVILQPLAPPVPDPSAQDRAAARIPVDPGVWRGGSQEGWDPASLDQAPVATVKIAPLYPGQLKQAGVTGSAVVDFIVDATGAVRRPYVRSATNEAFGAAAVQGVAKWRFRPGLRHGRPVNTHLQIPIIFSLNPAD
jgi:protein TonB